MLNRRSLITGLVSFVAAPAIVEVSSLMPVKQHLPFITEYVHWIEAIDVDVLYGNIILTPELIAKEAVRFFNNEYVKQSYMD